MINSLKSLTLAVCLSALGIGCVTAQTTYTTNITNGKLATALDANGKAINTAGAISFTDATAKSTTRGNLGVAIGTDVQAWSAILDAIVSNSGTVNISGVTLTLPPDVTRLGSSIDLASEVTGTLPWSSVGSTPTTLAGYGITNAVLKGSNTLTGALSLTGTIAATSAVSITNSATDTGSGTPYGLTVTVGSGGRAVVATSDTYALTANATAYGTGVLGTAVDGIGVKGSSTNAIGVDAFSTNSVALKASTYGATNIAEFYQTNVLKSAIDNSGNFTGMAATVRGRYTVVATTYSAALADKIQANTSSAAFTVTIPGVAAASVVAGDSITVEDAKGTWGTNNLTLHTADGAKINGVAADFIANVSSSKLTVTYIDSAYGWSVK